MKQNTWRGPGGKTSSEEEEHREFSNSQAVCSSAGCCCRVPQDYMDGMACRVSGGGEEYPLEEHSLMEFSEYWDQRDGKAMNEMRGEWKFPVER